MSTVGLTREIDGPDLVEALAEHGLKGELVSDEEHLTVQVEDCDEQVLAHAIEDWIRGRELPLVPHRLDDCTYAVAPPAG
ncbi:MAG TPA: hypothetical protein VJT84_02250 [Gaiellaceae bacterium]|nr:hypothetical protein [Gaiellaceae bacterium]